METQAMMTADQQAELLEKVVVGGDLSKLSPAQRVQYYRAVCQSVGVNPLTKPFDYIVLNGHLTLYATRTCTDQIRANAKISITITGRELVEDVYVVTARGTMPDGRTDEATGAVSIAGLKGDAKANAMLKAETKAKRRLTLSMVGLGWLDESEVGSVADAHPVRVDPDTGEILDAPAKAPAKTGPKAQHPLVAAGFPTSTVKQIMHWIGGAKSMREWTPEEANTARAVVEALLRAAHAGLAVEELQNILESYTSLDGANVMTRAPALVANIDALARDFLLGGEEGHADEAEAGV